jgi:hypothetical protein
MCSKVPQAKKVIITYWSTTVAELRADHLSFYKDQRNLETSSPSCSSGDGQDGAAAAAVAVVDEDEAMKMQVDITPGRSLHGACQQYKY